MVCHEKLLYSLFEKRFSDKKYGHMMKNSGREQRLHESKNSVMLFFCRQSNLLNMENIIKCTECVFIHTYFIILMGSFVTFDHIKCYKKGNSFGHLRRIFFQKQYHWQTKAIFSENFPVINYRVLWAKFISHFKCFILIWWNKRFKNGIRSMYIFIGASTQLFALAAERQRWKRLMK